MHPDLNDDEAAIVMAFQHAYDLLVLELEVDRYIVGLVLSYALTQVIPVCAERGLDLDMDEMVDALPDLDYTRF